MKYSAIATTLALMATVASAAPAFQAGPHHALDARAKKSSSSSATKVSTKTKATAVATATARATATGSASTGSSGNSSSTTSTGSITDACDIGYATQNGGTTGGGSAATTTVTTLEELDACATSDVPAVCLVSGAITGNVVVKVAADKTIAGAAGSSLTGVGLRIKDVSNVILRNLKIAKVLASAGDAVGIQAASNVWVDHLDLSSDLDNGKDYYDGLLDVTHASDYITISNTYLHDHYKASLVGHSDSNADEDTGHLVVTYANNWFSNVNSRGPSVRFGTAHIYNQLSETASTGINARMGAQLLIESTVFVGVAEAIESADSDTVGYATVTDVDLGPGTNTVAASTLTSVPYEYTLLGSDAVSASVKASAGQTLSF